MSDLIDNPAIGQNAPEFSVSDISGAVKRSIEGKFSHVRVRGEIGRVNRYGSGHIYYDLKDESAVLNAVTWKGLCSQKRAWK
jgi:exodeoxyribonuclease VII large subunit